MVKFVIACNKYYKHFRINIYQIFDILNLSQLELIILFFRINNQQFIHGKLQIGKLFQGENILDNEKTQFTNLDLPGGQTIRASAALEIHTDILSTLIEICLEWKPTNKDHYKLHQLKQSKIDSFTLLLWGFSNIIHNLRWTAYYKVLHDNCLVNWKSENHIEIIDQFPQFEFARKAAEIRINSHHMEALNILRSIIKSKNKKSIFAKSIKKGIIKLYLKNTSENDELLMGQAALIKYHSYLAHIKLNLFDGKTLNELVVLLTDLIKLMNSVEVNIGTIEDNEPLEHIPICVEENELIKKLSLIHDDTSATTIKKFIEVLIANVDKPYFWDNPFYRLDGKLYLSLMAFSAPNLSRYFDNWISKEGLSSEFKVSLFREFVLLEMNTKRKLEYLFRGFIPRGLDNDVDVFKSNIVFELKDCILFVEVTLFKSPIEYFEHEIIINRLVLAADNLSIKSISLRQQYSEMIGDKPIYQMILTKYPTYSGMVINNTPIIDYSLLDNYISKGEYTKAILINTKVGQVTKPFASIKYYSNGSEFNTHLPEFLNSPLPVRVLINNMKLEQSPLMPPYSKFSIDIGGIERISEVEISHENVDQLTSLLNFQYYGMPKGQIEEQVISNIDYLLSITFQKISNSKSLNSLERLNLLQSVAESKIIGIVHLNRYLIKAFGNISTKTKGKVKKKYFQVSQERGLKLFEKLEAKLETEIRLAEFTFPEGFSMEEELELIEISISIISSRAYLVLEEDDITNIFLCIALLSSLSEKHHTVEEFYAACNNFVELLNSSNYHQKARDFSEEILSIAIKRQQQPYAWNILFNCFTAQMNSIEAPIYGSLLFASLGHLDEIPYDLSINSYFTLLKYFRNFRYYELAGLIFKIINESSLSDYDKQKITLSYFYILFNNVRKSPEKLEEIYSFLNGNITSIIKFGTHSCIPWLGLLYNIIQLQKKGLYSSEFDLTQYITLLEEASDTAAVSEIKDKILGNAESIKALFINGLINSLETRESQDFSYESNQLGFLAGCLIRNSLLTNDAEGVMLASMVLSDQSFSYMTNKVTDEEPIKFTKSIDPNIENRIKNYQEYVFSKINLQEGQIFVWAFEFDQKVGCLVISERNISNVFELPGWDINALDQWTRKLKTFYFNSNKISSYSIEIQEIDYADCLKMFLFTDLHLAPFKEVFFCASTELMGMPHNLITNNGDFISTSNAICNVISIEFFLQNHEDVLIPKNFTMETWIPLEDGNSTISWGYSLLEPILEKYKSKIFTKRYPDVPLNGDINIFLAHGIRELNGFKVVRTMDDPTSSILSPQNVFGNGIIAILFICNSGSFTEDLYARQIISFSGELIKSGYKAVVSPFWPYDVTMSNRWLEVFLESMCANKTINYSVFKANNKLAEYSETTSQQFYAPQGRFAMHLFGNPNIKIAY